ncbi:hypothetical protein ACUYGA_24555 [Metapseudomonas otitidis]|uniref:hypothetical protein n=1 Tax=Metapseudomonas otitidis TaxID=319939 RepID=UPI00405565E6
MIDTNDKATQPLPLDEQPMKRKRGRPSTGKAMTPAEKQRAYRERQKRLRDQNSEQATGEYSAERFEELRLITVEISERCKAAEARVAELKKELELRDRKEQRKRRHRDEPAATLPEDKTYTLQARTGSGKWLNLVVGIYGEEASRQLDRVIDNKLSGGAKNRQYRLIEDGKA